MIKITGLEHVSWGAGELDPAQSVLTLFGINKTGDEEIHEQQVTATYFAADCGVRFEVIRPSNADSPLNRFLERRGPGLHHVCFQVESLDEACAEVDKRGWRVVGETFSDSRGRHVFIHPQSTGGVLIGLIELHPHLKSPK